MNLPVVIADVCLAAMLLAWAVVLFKVFHDAYAANQYLNPKEVEFFSWMALTAYMVPVLGFALIVEALFWLLNLDWKQLGSSYQTPVYVAFGITWAVLLFAVPMAVQYQHNRKMRASRLESSTSS